MASLPSRARLPRLRLVVPTLLLLGCGDSLEPSESANPPPPPPAPPTFALEVAVLTEGVNPDPDGYTISIDRLPLTTRARDTLRVAGLAAGSHTVAISGLSMNCRIPLGVYDVPTPRDEAWEVERPIEAFDGVVHMDFVIQCFEVGTLDLVVLSGTETVARQFNVTMNHDPRVATLTRGVKTRLKSVSVGKHYVWVRALCGFDLGRPRVAQVTVGAGLIVQDTIDVGSEPCK